MSLGEIPRERRQVNNYLDPDPAAAGKTNQTGDNVKDGCGKMLLVLKEHKITKVLNDNRPVTGP